nr:unnamed protein product [Callosobruchus chinensis]
MMCSAVLIEVI